MKNITIESIYDTLADYFGGDRITMIERYFQGNTTDFNKHLQKQYKVFLKYYDEATPMKITKNKTGAASIKEDW
jgi:cystathionine beta-lyase/cystathionine gamma-synthase